MSDKTVITIEDEGKGSFGHPGGFRFRFQSYEKGKLVAGVEKFMPVDVPSIDQKTVCERKLEVIKYGLGLLSSEEAKNMFNDKDACAEIGKILKADSILIQTWNVPHCSAQSFPFPSEVQEIEVKKESGRSWSVEFVRDFPIDAWHNHYTGYVVCVDRMVSGIYRLCDVHPSSEGEKQ